MSKITNKEDIRVVVTPGKFMFYRENTPEENMYEAERLVKDIKRHIDDFAEAYVAYATVHRCSFCNSIWEPVTAKEAAADPDLIEGIIMCCDPGRAESEEEHLNETK